MKKVLLFTSCLLFLPHMSYAMDSAGVGATQEEQRDSCLAVKRVLEIPYEKKIFLPNGSGYLPFPVSFVEFTQRDVEMELSFGRAGGIQTSLLFPAGFPYDLQSRILTAVNGVEIFPEEPNPDGFGCLSGHVTGGRETIGSYTEKPLESWDQIKGKLLTLKVQAYGELLALRGSFPVLAAVPPRGGEPLAVVDEELASSSGNESSMPGDVEEVQDIAPSATSVSLLESVEVLERVKQVARPSLSSFRALVKKMGGTVKTTKHSKHKRKIGRLTTTVNGHTATFSSKTDKSALKVQMIRFLQQVGGVSE